MRSFLPTVAALIILTAANVGVSGAAELTAGGLSFSDELGGFHLRKIITNATPRAWPLFELGLRENRTQPSDYYDGLSFDQLMTASRPFRADRYSVSREISEPFDYLRFSGGGVGPGETVTIDVVITDTSPRSIFYLVQQPKTPVARAGQD